MTISYIQNVPSQPSFAQQVQSHSYTASPSSFSTYSVAFLRYRGPKRLRLGAPLIRLHTMTETLAQKRIPRQTMLTVSNSLFRFFAIRSDTLVQIDTNLDELSSSGIRLVFNFWSFLYLFGIFGLLIRWYEINGLVRLFVEKLVRCVQESNTSTHDRSQKSITRLLPSLDMNFLNWLGIVLDIPQRHYHEVQNQGLPCSVDLIRCGCSQ